MKHSTNLNYCQKIFSFFKQNMLLLFFGLIMLASDQLTKYFIKRSALTTTGHLIDITYTTNTGTLFSLFSGTYLINIVFIVLSIFAIMFLTYLLRLKESHLTNFSYILLISGILGNFIDRLLYGSVIDWINIHFWPIFNLADLFLFIGIFLSILFLIKNNSG